ncbi:MAG: spermidine/putrescine ABC transporter substrate-binding protein [Oscillospiraceae bacterium]|nr:spermidine/putrescine ABC transporter substrate-binding protein [Oscillospiraceae bacterium]
MKNHSYLFLIFICFCSIFIYFANSSKKPTINVYSWGEFISNGVNGSLDVNAEFENETGINVSLSIFQSNEEMYANLIGGGADYDVVIPSDYMISRMIQENMLSKLNFDNIPNYKFINKNHKNLTFDPKNEYSVPYTWGVLGIFYNEKYVKGEISWESLWDKKYKGKILMFDNFRDAFGIPFIKKGISVNSIDENDWKSAAEELKIQKPLVQNYMMDQIYDKLSGEEAYIAPYYCGCSLPDNLINGNYINFVIPEQGTNKFVDSMCVPKISTKKTEAEKYINFMCQKRIALANASVSEYIPAQKDAEAEIISDSEVFSNYNFKKAQVYKNLPYKIQKLADDLWVEIKAGDENSITDSIILSIIFILLILIYLNPLFKKLIYFLKKTRKRKRCQKLYL